MYRVKKEYCQVAVLLRKPQEEVNVWPEMPERVTVFEM